MKSAIRTDPAHTHLATQATEDPDLLAATGRAAVREVETEIARILLQGDHNFDQSENAAARISLPD